MRKKAFAILGIFVLCLPIIAISIIYIALSINIFDNSDFWYGYMAYFGTTLLAMVSLWQNENANRINKSLSEENLYYQKVTSQRLFPFVRLENVSTANCKKISSIELKHMCPEEACTFDRYSIDGNSPVREEFLAINLDIDGIEDNKNNGKQTIQYSNGDAYKKSIQLNICNSSETVIRHILVDDVVVIGYKNKYPTRHCRNKILGNGFSYLLGPGERFQLTIDLFFINDSIRNLYDSIVGGVGIVLYITNTTITGIKQNEKISMHIRGERNLKVTYGDVIYTEESQNGQAENAHAE